MEKPANIDHPIHDLIRRRWSPRAFAARPVEAEKLASLFEAARWAPSSFNGQPWHYIVAAKDDEAAFARLLNCLRPQNIRWAQHTPVLIIAVAIISYPCRRSAGPTATLFTTWVWQMRISFSKRWHWGWLHTKWPDSFRRKLVRLSVFRRATKRSPQLRWVIRVILRNCRKRRRRGNANPANASP